MRVEQNYDHQTYEDLYGNRETFRSLDHALGLMVSHEVAA
jgi:hypothetical protein